MKNNMKLKDIKLNSQWYGSIATYSGPFHNGYKVKLFTIIKINNKSFNIKFGSKSNSIIQRIDKLRIDKLGFYKTELDVWKHLLEQAILNNKHGILKNDYDDYISNKVIKTSTRNIKRLEKTCFN